MRTATECSLNEIVVSFWSKKILVNITSLYSGIKFYITLKKVVMAISVTNTVVT